MVYRCVGCDIVISWSGEGVLCYTCPCGSHIFYGENSNFLVPTSLVAALVEKRDVPHLDYLIGSSSYTSPIKERLMNDLIAYGAIWMKDCPQCLSDGTYQRELEREKQQALMEADLILRSNNGDKENEKEK
jgi:hypothetical protein